MDEANRLHCRPKSGAMRSKFLEVANDFGVDLDHLGKDHLATVVKLIDLLDQHYGTLAGQARISFRTNLTSYLAGRKDFATADFYGFSEAGCLLIQGLSSVLDQRQCRAEFTDVIAEILEVSGSISSTADPSELVNMSVKEGELTADVVLMVVGATREDFASFWRLVCGTMNLADDMMDLPSDVASGEKSCASRSKFYLEGGARLLSGIARIIAMYPRKRKLFNHLQALPQSANARSLH